MEARRLAFSGVLGATLLALCIACTSVPTGQATIAASPEPASNTASVSSAPADTPESSTAEPQAAPESSVVPPPSSSPVVTEPAVVDWLTEVTPLDCSQAPGPMQIDHLDQGDVTADGIEDTFVTYSCQASTSSWPQRIEAFAGTAAGKPVRVGVLFTTEESVSYRSLRLESLSLSPQAVTMRAFGWSSFQPSALPDLIITQTFVWADGALVGGDRSVAPLENEPFTALAESAYPGVEGIDTVHDVGLIDGVDTNPLGARIKFDRVIWLWCSDTDKATQPEGYCSNNYHLTNDNDKRRTFILAPDVRILLLDPTTARSQGLRESTINDLAALVQSGRPPLCVLQRNDAGLVTAIGEAWTP